MNRRRVGEDMGSKEMDRCPLTGAPNSFNGDRAKEIFPMLEGMVIECKVSEGDF
jgi:hypothetical protein